MRSSVYTWIKFKYQKNNIYWRYHLFLHQGQSAGIHLSTRMCLYLCQFHDQLIIMLSVVYCSRKYSSTSCLLFVFAHILIWNDILTRQISLTIHPILQPNGAPLLNRHLKIPNRKTAKIFYLFLKNWELQITVPLPEFPRRNRWRLSWWELCEINSRKSFTCTNSSHI